jgi:hypothetical protein
VTEEAPPNGTPKHGWSTAFNLLMLVVGGAALAWLLRTTSWPELHGVITGVGMWVFVIISIDLASMCCDAAALHSFMRPEARMVSYARVLAAQLSGRAINVLTPFGALGEATKVTMLEGHAPRARVLSSIVLLNVSALYLNVALMAIGIPITLLLVDLPQSVKVIVEIGTAILVPGMILLGVMIHRGAVSSAVALIRAGRLISAERATAWKEKLTDVDKHIRDLHQVRSPGTRLGLVFVVISRVLATASTILIMVALHIELSPHLVIGVLSVGVLVAWAASVVPLGIGLADGGNYALYSVLGATGEHGMYFTLLGRVRTVVIAILGLTTIAVLNAYYRFAHWRTHRKLARMKAARD